MVTTATRVQESTLDVAAAIAAAESIVRDHQSGTTAATPFTPTGGAGLDTSNLEIVDNLTWS